MDSKAEIWRMSGNDFKTIQNRVPEHRVQKFVVNFLQNNDQGGH